MLIAGITLFVSGLAIALFQAFSRNELPSFITIVLCLSGAAMVMLEFA